MNKPIPCVGFELLYSPIDKDFVRNIAHSFHRITNQFIFNVVEELENGQEILILFSNSTGPTEQIPAKVKACRKLAEDHYQLTLETQADSRINIDKASLVTLPINRGPSTAQEIKLSCPCCRKDSTFRFIANQSGDWEKGILPIYNCSSCGTTRAITGLVNAVELIAV